MDWSRSVSPGTRSVRPRASAYCTCGGRVAAEPVLHGGGQERGRRSGTENVAGAVGLALALELATAERASRAAELTERRDQLIHGILTEVPGAILTGALPGTDAAGMPTRLPNSASFCFPGTNGEAICWSWSGAGFSAPAAHACAAGSTEPSHVLLALGYDPATAHTAVRFTLSTPISAEEVGETVRAISQAL